MPSFQPYWGKPAVRNDRGDRGDVGIIRSPVRASILSERATSAPPCAGIREDVGEASAGGRAGQPLSRDRKLIPGADAVCVAEGNMSKSANASAWATRRGRRTWHARTLHAWEPGDLQVGRMPCWADGPRREGEEP